jgi:hypothetical protein
MGLMSELDPDSESDSGFDSDSDSDVEAANAPFAGPRNKAPKTETTMPVPLGHTMIPMAFLNLTARCVFACE